jgi:hypothetical protein
MNGPMIAMGVGLFRHEGLTIKPNLRLVPTFVTISGGINVAGEDEGSRTNSNRLASFASASVKPHLMFLESLKQTNISRAP